MGLFASGYRILYDTTQEERYLRKAEEALAWLEVNACPHHPGMSWGHPFGWQSKIPIPRGTPSSVITAIIGDAFWRFYQSTQDHRFLQHCQSICEFFLRNLNIDVLEENSLCFSKTPLDHFHIHNGNLWVTDFLMKVGKVSGRKDDLEMAEKALTYTLNQQNEDGSFCYWGKDQEMECKIDHYHSGFEIRALYSIWTSTRDPRVYEALKKYYQFYCEHLITSEGHPKMTPRSLYPINIHSCAEAILCHSTLAPDFSEALDYLRRCVPWILQTMQHAEGWFVYMVRKTRTGFDWTLSIPYIRWGQAWMFRALAECYGLILKREKGRSTS
jgi:rhamnogalacturonyl hydrolase YesR